MAFNDYQFGLESDATSLMPGANPTPPVTLAPPIDTYQFGLESNVAPVLEQQMARTNQEVMTNQASPGMDYYTNLGSQIQQAIQGYQSTMNQSQQQAGATQPRQGQAAPQMRPAPQNQQTLPGSQAVPIAPSNVTSGFNMDWLAQRLDAGSANGAAIGGVGKNPGGGAIANDKSKGTPAGSLPDGTQLTAFKPMRDSTQSNRNKFIERTGDDPREVLDTSSWPGAVFQY